MAETITSGSEELDIFDIMQRFRNDGSCEYIIQEALTLLARAPKPADTVAIWEEAAKVCDAISERFREALTSSGRRLGERLDVQCRLQMAVADECATALRAWAASVVGQPEDEYVKRLENAFLMAYDLAGIDASPLPEALPESAYVDGYMSKVRELREVFAIAAAHAAALQSVSLEGKEK